MGTIGWTLQRRQSWFAALGEAVPGNFRAPGRLCARLPGTWGGLSRLRDSDGGGCRARHQVTAGPWTWAACRVRGVRKRTTDPPNGGTLPLATILDFAQSCSGRPPFPSQGPPRSSLPTCPGTCPRLPAGAPGAAALRAGVGASGCGRTPCGSPGTLQIILQ